MLDAKLVKRMRVARCLRLSTKEQNNGIALERQQFAVDEACQQIGGRLDNDLLFIDIVSGKKISREGLDKLIELIEAKLIDAVVFYRVDRVSRDVGVLDRIGKLLEKNKIQVYEVLKADFIRFENPNDWDYWMRSAIAAEGESRKLKARVKSSRAFARHKGQANMSVPFGYKRGDRQYQLDESVWVPEIEGVETHGMTVRQVAERQIEILLECRRPAKAVRLIAAELGKLWSPAGFSRWLVNEVLRGHTPCDRQNNTRNTAHKVIWNTHLDKVLLTEAIYQDILAVLKESSLYRGVNQKRSVYPLTGLVQCAKCGYQCHIGKQRSKKREYYYITCRSRKDGVPGRGCGAENKGDVRRKAIRTTIPMEELEAVVIDTLVSKAEHLVNAIAETLGEAPVNPEVLKLQHQIEQVQALASTMGDDDGLFAQKIRRLEQQIGQLEAKPIDAVARDSIQTRLKPLADRRCFEQMTKPELRAIFTLFVDRVLIADGKLVEVRLTQLLR
jgi:DNA invertase Pin-like site-specific DNA recombinase